MFSHYFPPGAADDDAAAFKELDTPEVKAALATAVVYSKDPAILATLEFARRYVEDHAPTWAEATEQNDPPAATNGGLPRQ